MKAYETERMGKAGASGCPSVKKLKEVCSLSGK